MASTPLVVFGDDWGRHVSSMQHLLRHLFTQHPTVWVNGIGHRVPSIADAGRAWQKLRQMAVRPQGPRDRSGTEGVVWSSGDAAPDIVINPLVVPLHHWRFVEPVNRWSLRRSIRGALRRLGGGRPLVVTGSPPSVSVAGQLDEVATIYLCMDDWAHLPTVSPHMLLPLERRLLMHADAVVATARQLTKIKVPVHGSVHYLPQGVNFEHFSTPRPVPEDLARLPRPWIGFAGGVGPALNLEILHRVAAEYSGGSVVLVGPQQPGLGELRGANIHCLGARPYSVLPAYVQAFDVGLIPYVRNGWTDSVDPLKLLEYLAAGIPVVTTDLPEVLKYAHAVTIAADTASFTAGVTAACAEDRERGRAARQRVAATHTWRARAEEFADIAHEVLRRKRGEPVAAPA